MDDALSALFAWSSDKKDALETITIATNILQFTSIILSNHVNFELASLFAKGVNHICSQRAMLEPNEEYETPNESFRNAVSFLYVVECQFRMTLIENKFISLLDDGTLIGKYNERCSRVTFDPLTPIECVKETLLQMQRPSEYIIDDAMMNQFAFNVCFERDGITRIHWDQIQTYEVLSSHVYATLVLSNMVQAFPQRHLPDVEFGNDTEVHAWHDYCMHFQHSDEFLVEITDVLIQSFMNEAEKNIPETLRVYREAKPRKGFHWYTRLRAFRDIEPCTDLYNRCNKRTTQMDDELKEYTLLSYIEYHMRHSNVESWRSLCYFDYTYPKEAIQAMLKRIDIPIGAPVFPACILRSSQFEYLVVDYNFALKQLEIVSRQQNLYASFRDWCDRILKKNDGLLAPRVSCKALITKILEMKTEKEKELDLHDEINQTDFLFTIG